MPAQAVGMPAEDLPMAPAHTNTSDSQTVQAGLHEGTVSVKTPAPSGCHAVFQLRYFIGVTDICVCNKSTHSYRYSLGITMELDRFIHL